VPETPPVILRYEGRSERFEQAKITVGRGKESDVRLADPNVSRRHAIIFWDRGRLFIEDLSSTNGSLLNGHTVEYSMLRNGDVVTAGATPITVEMG
jgi:pSer/pThr/pTyr-binding forkhead associated (FHA) protein